MSYYFPTLETDSYYHIYNRANGDDKLFLNGSDYLSFILKYMKFIDPVADTICYCYMPNHFHFLVRIRTDNELKARFPKETDMGKLLSKQFSKLFSSHAQTFNSKYNRKGSLFMKNFKRIKVTDLRYALGLILYIHINPVVAELCSAPENWLYSSYRDILNNYREDRVHELVNMLFDSYDDFVSAHHYELYNEHISFAPTG